MHRLYSTLFVALSAAILATWTVAAQDKAKDEAPKEKQAKETKKPKEKKEEKPQPKKEEQTEKPATQKKTETDKES